MGWTLLISRAGNEVCSFLLLDRCCVRAKTSSLLLFLSWFPLALVSPTPCTTLCFCHPKLFSAGRELLDLLLLAALIYPADWHLPTLTAHLSVPLASDLQQPNHGSAGVNDKNHILPESPISLELLSAQIARGLMPQWWTECLHAEMPFCAQSIGFVWFHNKSSYPFSCLLLCEVF